MTDETRHLPPDDTIGAAEEHAVQPPDTPAEAVPSLVTPDVGAASDPVPAPDTLLEPQPEPLESVADDASTDPVDSSAVELDEPAAPPPPDIQTLWQRIIGWFRPSPHQLESRLIELNQAVSLYPDAASNYLARGELYLALGETALAAADFRAALERAQLALETERWGLVAQVLQDRALAGLRRAVHPDRRRIEDALP